MKAMVLQCPGEPLTFVDRPEPRATAGRCSFVCQPAAFVVPTSTSSMVNCLIRICLSFPATKLLGMSRQWAPACEPCRSECGSAFPGSARHAANAISAAQAR